MEKSSFNRSNALNASATANGGKRTSRKKKSFNRSNALNASATLGDNSHCKPIYPCFNRSNALNASATFVYDLSDPALLEVSIAQTR